MDRLIWTAVTGMNASLNRQRMLASNMANAQTIGFRAEVMAFTPMTLRGPSLEARAMSDGAVRGAVMDAGALIHTAQPLDIAMTGDTLLAVQAETGEEAYTRRGDLSVGSGGVLFNGDGRPVLGEAGPLAVPPGSQVSITEQGGVMIRDPANRDAPPQQIGQLRLVSPQGSQIAKGLDGLFRVSGGGALPTDAAARVTTGALEQSNVNSAQVLVDMIEAQRLFDMRNKLVSTAKSLDEGGAALMRLAN